MQLQLGPHNAVHAAHQHQEGRLHPAVDADQVQAVHKATMRILKEIGIEFLNPEAVAYLKQVGCTVNGTNVKMDEEFVMEMLSHAPSEFTITPRNPDRELIIGGKHMVFVNVSSPPNAWDLERGNPCVIARSAPTWQSIRHCEERSDVAIQRLHDRMHWIATLRSQ